jgi:hypothetical protein
MPDEQVRIDVVADDHASKPIDAIAKKVDKLEQPVDIPIGADTDDAQRDITGLLKKVDGLARDPANILLASNAAKIASDIADLLADVDRLDAADPEVQVKSQQINALTGDLDQLEQKLRDINGTNVDIDASKASAGLKQVSENSESTRSSVSSMANSVGNNASEMGAAFGIDGPLGQSMGEFGEYMTEARLEGDRFGTVLRNFGKVAGPIVLVSLTTKLISDHFAKLAEDTKFNADQSKRWAASLADGADEAAVLRKELESTGDLKFKVQIEGPDIDVDAGGAIARAGLSLEQFAALGKLSKEGFDAWAEGAERAGVSEKDLATISLALAATYQQQAKAREIAANNATLLGETTMTEREAVLAATLAQDAQTDALNAGADAARDAARDAAGLTRSTMLAEQAARDLGAQWDALTGQLDAEQAIANIGSDFDDMRAKGADAWAATAAGAQDAKAKQEDYSQSVLSSKQHVTDLGKQIGLSIPTVKDMLLRIDSGDIDRVEQDLRILTRNRTMNLSIIANGGQPYVPRYGPGSGPQMVAPSAPVEVVNVTQHLPRGWRGNALAEARASARRSGGLYRRVRR